jgi:acyl carrier protein
LAEIETEIKSLVSKIIKVPEDKLDVNVNIFTEYGIDSLLGVEILAGLDKKYDLDIAEDKIRSIKTVNDIIRITKELLAKKGR